MRRGSRSSDSSHPIDVEKLLADQLATASPDLLRGLLSTFIAALMSAEADALCGAGYGERSQLRANSATGIGIAISTPAPARSMWRSQAALGKLFPGLAAGPAQARRAGADQGGGDLLSAGVSTRRMERLVESLAVTSLSKSQVSVMAKELDEAVEAFRTRPLDAGPYTFVAADALVLKVREDGRVVGVHTLVATGSTPRATARSSACR